MAWSVEVSPRATEQLEKLDPPVARRILDFLYKRLKNLTILARSGERLHGPLSEFWKYRVGDYRLIVLLRA